MKNLVQKYQIGENIEKHNPKHIAEKINWMLNNQNMMQKWKQNTKFASTELNWENEQKVITAIL
jgi:hypothetical protein